ncbi:MAG: DUF1610 domain-containing protein [Archaeoglobi archaeon]|nr:DUF1610 domain-containing protein [Candidatus Mnemosynella sp.]
MTLKEPERCTSCNAILVERGFTRFPCPSCGTPIGRCWACRRRGNAYTCPSCGFTGP